METLLTIIATAAATAIAWGVWRLRRQITIVDDVSELLRAVQRHEHRLKMLQGRLNQIAPPRGDGEAEEALQQPPERPLTRSEFFAHLKRQGRF